jgi:nucleotide-binding universal stress UspA family protein
MSSNEYNVVLAVGPDGVGAGALDVATSEAVRRGTGLELVHVVHPLVAPADADQIHSLGKTMDRVGHAVLTEAAAQARAVLGDQAPVSTELRYGPVAATLSERASEADLVVLERRDAGTVERLLTMSVSSRVAAHAHAAVVVVPRSWTPVQEALSVTVGVDRPEDAWSQVEQAAAYARETGRPLVVLHAVWLAEPYQELAFMDGGRQRWMRDATGELQRSLKPCLDAGGPEPRLDVRWQRPSEALVEATRSSSVVVLSRRSPRLLGGAHLGPITRAVLHHAAGPVMVVDRT